MLTVVGLAKTRVMYQATGIVPTTSGVAPYTHRDNSNEDLIILNYDVQLASFGGKAPSGEHNFPFSVVMPSELPPSMKVRARKLAVFHGFFHERICIVYIPDAHLVSSSLPVVAHGMLWSTRA